MVKYYIQVQDEEIELEVGQQEGATVIQRLRQGELGEPVKIDFADVHSNINTGEGLYSLIADGKSYQVHVEQTDDGLRMVIGRYRMDVRVLTEREWRLKKVAASGAQPTGKITIKAPMPGLVKGVLVAEGDIVHEGQHLVVLEAMKMENEIISHRSGKIIGVHITQGATVESGTPLITLE